MGILQLTATLPCLALVPTLLVICCTCIGFTRTSNPCHGSYSHIVRGDGLPNLDGRRVIFENSRATRQTVERALIDIQSLRQRITDLQRVYDESGRYGGETFQLRDLSHFCQITHTSDTCSSVQHLKRTASYAMLEKSIAYIGHVIQSEQRYDYQSAVILRTLLGIQEKLSNIMCHMHRIPCRVQTYGLIAIPTTETMCTRAVQSRSDRFNRDYAVFDYIKQVLTCTHTLLSDVLENVETSNQCGSTVECGACMILV